VLLHHVRFLLSDQELLAEDELSEGKDALEDGLSLGKNVEGDVVRSVRLWQAETLPDHLFFLLIQLQVLRLDDVWMLKRSLKMRQSLASQFLTPSFLYFFLDTVSCLAKRAANLMNYESVFDNLFNLGSWYSSLTGFPKKVLTSTSRSFVDKCKVSLSMSTNLANSKGPDIGY